MKKLVLSLIAFLVLVNGYAQKKLSNSRQSSYYAYYYKLTDPETERYLTNPEKAFSEGLLHSRVDSAAINGLVEEKKKLPSGNYLRVYVADNKLQHSLNQVNNLNLLVFNNGYDLQFALQDKKGKVITDAIVRLGRKTIAFDTEANLYHTRKPDVKKYITISYQGHTNFFALGDSYYRPTQKRRSFIPAPRVINDQKGYLVFNKPKYKPNDTVKFKAYILSPNGKPLKSMPIDVMLNKQGETKSKKLATLKPYRDGAYTYSFVLNDSLKLNLDTRYIINLVDPNSAKSKKTIIKEDQDDEDIAINGKNLISGQFYYEEYELGGLKFSVRADKGTHSPGLPINFYLKASDENDLAVPDARVEMVLLKRGVIEYHAKKVFVPDTLWKFKKTLDPVGETKVVIPDSVFPQADMQLYAEFVMLNSNNERRRETKYFNYAINQNELFGEMRKDSVFIDYRSNDKSVPVQEVLLIAKDNSNDNLYEKIVSLPALIKYDPRVSRYALKWKDKTMEVSCQNFQDKIQLSGNCTADSLFFKVDNPLNIPFWYNIFYGKDLKERGQATQLNYKKNYNGKQSAQLVVQYVWAGSVQTKQINKAFREKLLNIKMNMPEMVYPGQTVDMELQLTDPQGKPANDVDLTAFAFTSKFKEGVDVNIYSGRTYPYRNQRLSVYTHNISKYGIVQMDWERWRKRAGLDSIEYYKFSHPEPIYSITEKVDTLTQIAPFAFKDGNLLPVHILYIDERPVYFSKTSQLQHYSFEVHPGQHSIRMRTANYMISMDSVMVLYNKRTVMSVLADINNSKAKVVQMPDTLSSYESNLINGYMISVASNFGENQAYIEDDGKYLLLNPSISPRPYYYRNNDWGYNDYSSNTLLVGPLSSMKSKFTLRDVFDQPFRKERNYTYMFNKGLLKLTSTKGIYPFGNRLDNETTGANADFRKEVVTLAHIDSLWEHYLDMRSHTTNLFDYNYVGSEGNGKLYITTDSVLKKTLPLIKNIIIYNYDRPDFIKIYPGNTTDFGYLQPSTYRLMYLLKGNTYFVQEKVVVKANGINYVQLNGIKILPKDSISTKINDIIMNRKQFYEGTEEGKDQNRINELFNNKYFDTTTFSDSMTGQVRSKDDRQPLPGVIVKVKGTSTATVTNDQGLFNIRVPKNGKLEFRYIGFENKEIDIVPGVKVNVEMQPDTKSLNEVVVTAYGIGKAAKNVVMREIRTEKSTTIALRGNTTLSGNQAPIIIVDGVPYEGKMGDLAEGDVREISVLKSDAATAIYGSRGANGVIIISTKKGGTASNLPEGSDPSASLRKNFSDYAFWQPALFTDKDGKAKFKVTFPDDITSWKTYAIGVGPNKLSGFAEMQIRSFKSLSANFVSPQFAVEGDSLKVIGKLMSYTPSEVKATRTFKYNNELIKSSTLSFKNAQIDTFAIVAANRDSLSFEYMLKQDNGYFDGERRKIPVYKQGLEATKGYFEALEKDTTLSFNFDPTMGPVTLRAEASAFPELLSEAESIRNYEYLCNEQLASKLKALLAEKRIHKYLSSAFIHEKNIQRIIKQLKDSKRQQGLWGWWPDSPDELWISQHVVEALLDAESQGYSIALEKQKIIDYLVLQITSYSGVNKINAFNLLVKLGAKIDLKTMVTKYEQERTAFKYISTYDQLRFMELKQAAGMEVKLDSLMKKMKRTMFGNVYWGENSYRFWDNSIQYSVMAYRILRNEGKHDQLLPKIRNYFLEQRKNGKWRNTYESSLILETILPDMFKADGTKLKPASLTLSNGATGTIDKFPYTVQLDAKSKLEVIKKGDMPVYITAYQRYWDNAPKRVEKDFIVNTSFVKDGKKLKNLKAGEPITLQVDVDVKADADYVMIEVPIPAGCSYQNKTQSYYGNEVHREYFKQKTSIFCKKLKQGKYTFNVSLLPRYNGRYILNPAKAEMMYFPVFFGREGMKKVSVE